MGNTRHSNLHNPLTQLENIIWDLIFRIAHHQMNAETAYTSFFTNDIVRDILIQPPDPTYNDSLCEFLR